MIPVWKFPYSLRDAGHRIEVQNSITALDPVFVPGRVESGLEWEGNLFARTAEERSDWFRFYRDLIQLRLKSRELLRGRFQLIDAGEDVPPAQRTVIAFERRLRRSALRCAVNLGPEPRALASFCPQPGETVLFGQMTGSALPPFCAIVVRAG